MAGSFIVEYDFLNIGTFADNIDANLVPVI